jgi:hypothetical protein
MSVSGVEPNQTIVTRYDEGFVVKNSGTAGRKNSIKSEKDRHT